MSSSNPIRTNSKYNRSNSANSRNHSKFNEPVSSNNDKCIDNDTPSKRRKLNIQSQSDALQFDKVHGTYTSLTPDCTNSAMMKIEETPRLDPNDPVQCRRIQQRHRLIEKGKNTVGYDNFCRTVPKGKRKRNSLNHPATPDHKADIPNRRWFGLVSAWRRSLHQFDPPDMDVKADKTTELEGIMAGVSVKPLSGNVKNYVKSQTIREIQINEASNHPQTKGLVEFGDSDKLKTTDDDASNLEFNNILTSGFDIQVQECNDKTKRISNGSDSVSEAEGMLVSHHSHDDILIESADDSDDDLL